MAPAARRAVLAVVLGALVAGPVAAQPQLLPYYLPPVAAGVIGQGESDAWTPLTVCFQALWRIRLTLVAVAWVPGDMLTLEVRSVWGPLSGPTQGMPPQVTIDYTSPDSCAVFRVHGTEVAAKVGYAVVRESF